MKFLCTLETSISTTCIFMYFCVAKVLNWEFEFKHKLYKAVKNKFQFLEDNLFRRSVVQILHCGDVLSTAPELTVTIKIFLLKSRQNIGRGSENDLASSSIEALENSMHICSECFNSKRIYHLYFYLTYFPAGLSNRFPQKALFPNLAKLAIRTITSVLPTM